MEGSILIGVASIIYSLAIAVIPFISKRIVSGDVGSTAAALIGAAATAATLGAATVEGAAVGAAAGSTGAGSASSGASPTGTGVATRTSSSSDVSNQPAAVQSSPSPALSNQPAASSSSNSSAQPAASYADGPTLESHAEQMRGSFADAMGESGGNDSEASGTAEDHTAASGSQSAIPSAGATPFVGPRSAVKSSATARRGPSVHRFNIGTWSAFHAARVATQGVASIAGKASNADKD